MMDLNQNSDSEPTENLEEKDSYTKEEVEALLAQEREKLEHANRTWEGRVKAIEEQLREFQNQVAGTSEQTYPYDYGWYNQPQFPTTGASAPSAESDEDAFEYLTKAEAKRMADEAARNAAMLAVQLVGQTVTPQLQEITKRILPREVPDWAEVGAEVEAMVKAQGFRDVADCLARNPKYFETAVNAARYNKILKTGRVPSQQAEEERQRRVAQGATLGGPQRAEQAEFPILPEEQEYLARTGMSEKEFIELLSNPAVVDVFGRKEEEDASKKK